MNTSKIETPYGRIEDGKLIVDFKEIIPSFSQLARLAHETAKEKGFWDTPRTIQHCLAMVGTEVIELMQASEVHGPCDAINIDKALYWEDDIQAAYDMVLDTPAGEAVDIIIRLLDIFGNQEFDDDEVEFFFRSPYACRSHKIAMADIFSAVKTSSKMKPRDAIRFDDNIKRVIWYAINRFDENVYADNGIGITFIIRAHIVAKILFNKTRPAKHGKIA